MKILYIEDDRTLQPALQRFFRINYPDAAVTTTEGVAESIHELNEAYWRASTTYDDVIVSDFNIRGGTGADVLDWCYMHRPWLAPRFIFLSGKSQKHAAFEATTENMRVKLLGHPHWLVKPTPMPELRALIERLVQS